MLDKWEQICQYKFPRFTLANTSSIRSHDFADHKRVKSVGLAWRFALRPAKYLG